MSFLTFLKRFNKEQMTCGAFIVLAILLLFMGTAGGASVEPVKLPTEAERAYKGPPARTGEFVVEKLDAYLTGGRNPFEGASTSTLPLPEIKGPEPRPEDLVVPHFRPAPSFEALNRNTTLVSKYRPMTVGAPSMTDADLPSQAEFDELKALVEPEVPAVTDRRNEKEFENDVLHLKDSKPVEGRFVVQTTKGVLFRDIKTGGTAEYPFAILAKDPESPTEYWIDRAWTNDERWKKKSEKMSGRDLEKQLKLGRWAAEKGMVPEAKESYRAAITAAKQRMDLKGDFLVAARELHDLMVSRGDLDGALALNLEMAAVTQFDKAEFMSRCGDCLRAMGVTEGAAEHYRLATNESPRYVRSRVALGRALYELGRDDDARAILTQLPNFVVPQTPPADVTEGHVVGGLLALRAADPKAARVSFDAALKVDANSPEAKLGLAVVCILEGAPKDAAPLLVAALKANQYLIDAWLDLGSMYLAAGKVDQADAMFAQARLRDPSSAEALVGQAVVQIVKGSAKDGQPLLEAALKVDPTHHYAHYALGTLLAPTDGAAALAHFEAALRDEFFFLPAYNGAAMTYLASARQSEIAMKKEGLPVEEIEKLRQAAQKSLINAETLLKNVQRLDPARVNTLVALGCIFAAQGKAGEATAILQAAQSKLEKTDPLIAYALGYIEFRFGSGDPKSRLENAKVMLLRGKNVPQNPADPVGSAWSISCGEALLKVQEWLETIVRLDDRFEGRDGEVVGMNWYEFEDQGPKITVEKGRLHFLGLCIGKPYFLTSLERDTPRGTFQSFEVTLVPDQVGKCEYGIAVLTNRANTNPDTSWTGLWVGFDSAGKLRYHNGDTINANGGQIALTGTESKVAPPDPKMVRLKIERGVMGNQGQSKCLNIYVWNPAKNDYDVVMKDLQCLEGAGNDYRVMIWGRTDKNAEYSFYADNARILERTKK